MPILDVDAARAALQADDFKALIGVRESVWLDVKSRPYRLDDPDSAAELVKDVAAMANASGGLVLIGYKTSSDVHGEVVDSLVPVPEGMVDVDRYHKLVDQRVSPHVRHLSIRWIAVTEGKGVVVIDVPSQREADKVFVVPGPEGTKSFPSVGVPIRRGEGTVWLPQHEIQRLLAAGWSASGGLTAKAMRAIVADSMSQANARTVSPAPQPIGVGEGDDPGTVAAFEEAYLRAGGEARLGRPTTRVIEIDRGFVQYLAGGGDDRRAVLCARPGEPAIAVAGSVWDALLALPGRVRPAGANLTGLPVARQDESSGQLIDYISPTVTEVALDGGLWGRGRMVRLPSSGQWRWQPTTQLVMEASASRQLPSAGAADLTVRAVAKLAWKAGTEEWEITKGGRQRLLAALPRADINNAAVMLSRWRDVTVTPPAWELPVGDSIRQTGSHAQYQSVLWTADGQAAVRTTVRLDLPTVQQPNISTAVELQIDLAAWQSVLTQSDGAAGADPRLTAQEIVHIWMAAWDGATMVVPLPVIDDPLNAPLVDPPQVELQVKASDRYPGQGPDLQLTEVLDLSAFGSPTGQPSQEGAVTIIAPIGCDSDHRQKWATKALTRLARRWTFADADEGDLG